MLKAERKNRLAAGAPDAGARRFMPRLGLVGGGVLSLRLPEGWPESGLPLAWHWQGLGGQALEGAVERLSELPPQVAGAAVRAWTPPADTLLTQARIPTRARAKILQALPYALEEQLLGEPETLHFAFRPRPDGSLAVAVTAKERLTAWTGALKAAELDVESLCPASLLPAWEAGRWSLALDGDQLLVRTDETGGFVCLLGDGGEVPAELALAIEEARGREAAPGGLRVAGAAGRIDTAAWAQTLGLPVEPAEGGLWGDVPAVAPINLLQREFGPSAKSRQALYRLRPAAIMLGIWLLVGLGFNGWDWWQLSRQHQAQRAEMLALFQRSFPEARAVVDPALQMERNLATLQAKSGRGGPDDMLSLLARVAPALGAQAGATLRGLQYGEASLTVDIQLKDYQGVETLKNGLAAQGLKVEVLSASQRGEQVEARLRVKSEKRA
ncbi:MAG TPA: type II secretion system protein GspL [Acidiferrobacterales bacterium]